MDEFVENVMIDICNTHKLKQIKIIHTDMKSKKFQISIEHKTVNSTIMQNDRVLRGMIRVGSDHNFFKTKTAFPFRKFFHNDDVLTKRQKQQEWNK